MTFIDQHGLIQYARKRPVMTQADLCELCGPGEICRGVLVFDHCHVHGWIRGVICQGWNMSLAGPFGMETRLRAGAVAFGCKHWHRVQSSADNCAAHLRRVSARWVRALTHLRNCPDCQIPEMVVKFPELRETA